MNTISENPGDNEIISLIKDLDERIKKIERILSIRTAARPEKIVEAETSKLEYADKEDQLEYQIGQFWFAKAGIVILMTGIVFFLTFPYKNLPPVIPAIIGSALTFIAFVSAHYCRKIFNYISGVLYGGGLVLLYFTIMRMHYFGTESLIANVPLEISFLIITVAVEMYLSVRKNSFYLFALSLTLGYVTAVLSNQSYFIFISVFLLSSLSVYIKLKYGWNKIIYYSIILAYAVHLIWFINNPFVTGQIQTLTSPEFNLVFLLMYCFVFALGNILRKNEFPENITVIGATILNAVFCYGLLSLITISMVPGSIYSYHLAASILFLSLSIIFWVREKSKYSTFIFAILGYLALSVAIVVESKTPGSFLWLCWQSLLVVSTAIWFRSKYIILANFIIYLVIFFAYLALEGKIHIVSLSFGIVALLSARILNWKKDRLELKTEQMRNAYLLSALFIIPYALYYAMPDGLISVSWIAVAIIYYSLSLILKNKKYRWMALLTLLLTIAYVFIIGFTGSDPTYKIVSFLLLGAVLISVSLIYTKYKKSIKNIMKS